MFHRVIRSKNLSVSYTDCHNRLFRNIPVLYLSFFRYDFEIYPAWLFETYRKFKSHVELIKSRIADWERQSDIRQLQHSTVCTGIADAYWRYDTHVLIKCGEYDRGRQRFCPRCLRILKLEYPQGWSYYPGDVCRHGKYVGGCGSDIMCGRCESE